MPDAIFANAKETEPKKGKPIWKSKTALGTLLTIASVFVPQVAPILDNWNEITALIGAGLTIWGRVRAEQPIAGIFRGR